jgi:hypothetical protein
LNSIEIKYLEKYAFADPAAGKGRGRAKNRLARQAIVVAGRDWLDRWFVLHTWAGRETASSFKQRILSAQQRWNPRTFRIEANGMQVLFGSLVRDAAEELFLDNARFIPAYQPTKVEKTYRIRTGLEPIINDGRLFLLDKTGELAVELRGFPTAQTKDLVDALESVIRFAPRRPEKEVESREVEQYAEYLRSTGCAPHLIAKNVADFRQQLKERN